jgi:hypothetical protein
MKEKTAKKVVKDLFSKTGHFLPAPARTKDELTERLLIAHMVLYSILTENTGKGGLAEQWQESVKDIEERLKNLRKDFEKPQPRCK